MSSETNLLRFLLKTFPYAILMTKSTIFHNIYNQANSFIKKIKFIYKLEQTKNKLNEKNWKPTKSI